MPSTGRIVASPSAALGSTTSLNRGGLSDVELAVAASLAIRGARRTHRVDPSGQVARQLLDLDVHVGRAVDAAIVRAARARERLERRRERADRISGPSCSVERRYASAVGSPNRLHNAAATASRSAGSMKTFSGWRALDMTTPGEGCSGSVGSRWRGLGGELLHTERTCSIGPTGGRVRQITST